jgi:hypothetical protein
VTSRVQKAVGILFAWVPEKGIPPSSRRDPLDFKSTPAFAACLVLPKMLHSVAGICKMDRLQRGRAYVRPDHGADRNMNRTEAVDIEESQDRVCQAGANREAQL